jgi:hypothetical protein
LKQNWERTASVKMKQNFINQLTEPKPKINEPLSVNQILKHLFDDEEPEEVKRRTLEKETVKVSIHSPHCFAECIVFYTHL